MRTKALGEMEDIFVSEIGLLMASKLSQINLNLFTYFSIRRNLLSKKIMFLKFIASQMCLELIVLLSMFKFVLVIGQWPLSYLVSLRSWCWGAKRQAIHYYWTNRSSFSSFCHHCVRWWVMPSLLINGKGNMFNMVFDFLHLLSIVVII